MHSAEQEKLKILLNENCWISCRADGYKIEMAKLQNCQANVKNPSPEANHLLLDGWLDLSLCDDSDEKETGNSTVYGEFPKPLGDNEQFCSNFVGSIKKPHTFIPEVTITVDQDYEVTLQPENLDTIFPLFISHIFSSAEHQGQFRYENITFKKVMIFGIIVETSTSIKRNSVIVDDGTGEITCYFDVQRDSYEEEFQVMESSNDPFSIINQMLFSMLSQHQYMLPSFEEIQIGDRVCVLGDITFHKDNFYLFIEKLERAKDVQAHIAFLNRVFQLFQLF